MDLRVRDTGWVISGEGRVRNDVDGELTYEVLKKDKRKCGSTHKVDYA